jgi:ubiquinone/menaquinone biosynthesis C-methylase UbiE
MDRTRYSWISHSSLAFNNPIGSAKLDRLLEVIHLPPGARAVDMGAGKGELAIRLVERFAIAATVVDIAPLMTAEAERRAQGRIPPDRLIVRSQDARAFADSIREPFDFASCVGSTHAFGWLDETLDVLDRAAKPGGLILVGEGYWKRPPDPAYLKALDCGEESYRSHEETVRAGSRRGLIPLRAVTASEDEWDDYEWTTKGAIEEHVRTHPDDPDADAMLERSRSWREVYLTWGRSTLGFGLYLFRKPMPPIC